MEVGNNQKGCTMSRNYDLAAFLCFLFGVVIGVISYWQAGVGHSSAATTFGMAIGAVIALTALMLHEIKQR